MTDTDVVGLGNNPIIADTTTTATMIPTKDAPGCIVGTAENITGVLDNAQILISTLLRITLNIEGHLLTEAHQLTHNIAADHALGQHTGQL